MVYNIVNVKHTAKQMFYILMEQALKQALFYTGTPPIHMYPYRYLEVKCVHLYPQTTGPALHSIFWGDSKTNFPAVLDCPHVTSMSFPYRLLYVPTYGISMHNWPGPPFLLHRVPKTDGLDLSCVTFMSVPYRHDDIIWYVYSFMTTGQVPKRGSRCNIHSSFSEDPRLLHWIYIFYSCTHLVVNGHMSIYIRAQLVRSTQRDLDANFLNVVQWFKIPYLLEYKITF